jgi:DNA-binding Lrp family transcriptional regulator
MSPNAEIDDIDLKILSALIKDARARLKDIARECDISSVAVLHRIRHLKAIGVITGATLFPDLSKIGGVIIATLGIDLEAGKEEEIITLIKEQTNLIEPSTGIGKYDLCALVFAENLIRLEKATQTVRKHKGVRRVAVNMWVSQPVMAYENVELQPERT